MTALASRPATGIDVPAQIDAEVIERVIIHGDLKKLSPEQKVAYYNSVCQAAGLDARLNPFEYLTLNGKEMLYAKKSCTDQLRNNRRINVQIVSREKVGDCYVVTARAMMPNGREDESIGAVSIGKATGDNLANALMKAETKAKRRATLSICGLGILDEVELDTIPHYAAAAGGGGSLKDKLKAAAEPAPAPVCDDDAWMKKFDQSVLSRGGTQEQAVELYTRIVATEAFRKAYKVDPEKANARLVENVNLGKYDLEIGLSPVAAA